MPLDAPIAKVQTCLLLSQGAEDAATFYTSLLEDSFIRETVRPDPDGEAMVVAFTLQGADFIAMNGNPDPASSGPLSIQIATDDQDETDRYWAAITGNGGRESDCGWCKDRWGHSWQITPRRLLALTTDPDRAVAARAMQAMMSMQKIDIATIEAAARG